LSLGAYASPAGTGLPRSARHRHRRRLPRRRPLL